MALTTINRPDDQKALFGTGNDLEIYHSGTYNRSYINATGTNHDLTIAADEIVLGNSAMSEALAKFTADGAVELYHNNIKTFETQANGITVLGPEGGDAEVRLKADEGDDNADLWRINADTGGVFQIQNYTAGSWEANIECNGNGNVELLYDNLKKLETDAGGIAMKGVENAGGQIKIGIGSDMQLEHDGSNSYLTNTTGNLGIQSDNLHLQAKTGGEYYFKAVKDGAVELYYDNSKKLETTSDGATVTGSLAVHIASATGEPGINFTNSDTGTGTSNGFGLGINDAESPYIWNRENTAIRFATNNSERMRLHENGRFGIGTTTPYNKLTIKGDGDDVIDLIYSGTAGGHASKIQFRDFRDFVNAQVANNLNSDGSGSGDADLDFYTATGGSLGHRMRIHGDGDIVLGGASTFTNGSVTFDPASDSGTCVVTWNRADNVGWGTALRFQNNTGTKGYIRHDDSSVQYYSASDYRLKENDVNIADGITKVKQLRPIRFNWKGHSDTVEGFFAHEVQAVMPDAVAGTKDAVDDDGKIEPQMLEQARLVPLLTAALKEAITKIETLETKVAALEAG